MHGQRESYSLLVVTKTSVVIMEISAEDCHIESNNLTQYDPGILVLVISYMDSTSCYINIYASMFTVALFITLRKLNQHKCPPTNKLIMKMCTVGFYSQVKKETMKFAGKWMKLENIL